MTEITGTPGGGGNSATGVKSATRDLAAAHSAKIIHHTISTLRIVLADLGGPPDGRDDPVGAILDARPDLARELHDRVLGPVMQLGWADREVLLETLAGWLAAGNAKQAAKTLYCHRNTVRERLRRLERLTRRSLSTPGDIAELALASRVHDALYAAPTQGCRTVGAEAGASHG